MHKQNKVINPVRYEVDSENTRIIRSYANNHFTLDAQSFYRRYAEPTSTFLSGIRICLKKLK